MDKEKLGRTVADLSKQVNEYYGNILRVDPTAKVALLGVLKGAFMFFSDLCKGLDFEFLVEFVRLKSYEGEQSVGHVQIQAFNAFSALKGYHILVIEDIIDTGLSMIKLKEELLKHEVKDVQFCALFIAEGKDTVYRDQL